MGYTTEFTGSFAIDRPLSPEHAAYLRQFSGTRRMKRVSDKTEAFPDPVRHAVGMPVGIDGGYFVGGSGWAGQGQDSSIVDYNRPPSGQPGLWCKWEPNEDGTAIEWNGHEKFYEWEAWLRYLVEHFLRPWGYTLNGEVEWEGEDQGDVGKIVVTDNNVTVKKGRIIYE
jgi:hypothetical protein